jgi:hypothetical protein
MAPPKMTTPTIGTAARTAPSGRFCAIAAPSGNMSHPPTANAAHHQTDA